MSIAQQNNVLERKKVSCKLSAKKKEIFYKKKRILSVLIFRTWKI